MFPPLQTVALPNGAVRFAEEGDPAADRALVLVHAFPVGVGVFEPQRGAFDGWRAIVPALPGFDGSDLPASDTVVIIVGDEDRLTPPAEMERMAQGHLTNLEAPEAFNGAAGMFLSRAWA